MIQRIIGATLLVALGYLVGSLHPSARATDGAAGIVQELKNIHNELTTIRRVIEKR